MKSLTKKIVSFLREEEGLTAVEYAIAGALVALIAAGGFTLLGQNVNTELTTMASCVAGTGC